MVESSLWHHMYRTHGRSLAHTREGYTRGGGRYTYLVYLPRVLHLSACTVEGCPYRYHTSGRLLEHFMYRDWKFRVVILKEGASFLLWFLNCGMNMILVLMDLHPRTARCNQATEMQLKCKDVELDQREGYIECILYGQEDDPIGGRGATVTIPLKESQSH